MGRGAFVRPVWRIRRKAVLADAIVAEELKYAVIGVADFLLTIAA